MRNLKDKIINAPNFRYGEFVKSYIATRLGIENIPNEEQWRCIELLASNILQPIRDTFGAIRISSGFRSVKLCEAIGSSKHSNHTRGQAVDIEPLVKGVTLYEILEFVHNKLDYRELIAEYFPEGWCHIAYREGANNKQLKLKDKKHDYLRVNLNYIKSLYSN